MSGFSASEVVSLLDECVDLTTSQEDEVEILEYAANESYDIDDDADAGGLYEEAAHVDPRASEPTPSSFEIPLLQLPCGEVRVGTVLELKNKTARESHGPLSGDFVLVRKIIEETETGDVEIKGYPMRRVRDLPSLFESKVNDLFMLIKTREGDGRPRFEQGLVVVPQDEIVRERKCVFTNLRYKELGREHVNPYVPVRLETVSEIRDWLFHRGTLICRWMHVLDQEPDNKSYGGEVRHLLKHEVADFSENTSLPSSSFTRAPVWTQNARASGTNASNRTHKRSSSVEECHPRKRLQRSPQKPRVQTIGDGFCCAGGVSLGAQMAGMKVSWGLECDPIPMEAYRRNFAGARHFEMRAQDFTGIAKRGTHGVDHLHMSCPCCYWSIAHSVPGKNDQENMEAIFTVGPWLRALKPMTFSLEQTPGFIQIEEHKNYFRTMLRDILEAGYSVRWKVQDQAWFGIPQHRRRLIFIGARNGFPIPPFPSPTHGPEGSGLKRYVTIDDALRPLAQQAHSLRHDIYHQPHREKKMNAQPFDPRTNLARCITTSGGMNAHHSGKRNNTCRELASFQGLPTTFQFAGTPTQAKKQCGNAWPTKTNTVYFALWAAHKEAFEAGLIGEEDEVLDLYDFLEQKGFTIPGPQAIDIDEEQGDFFQNRRAGAPEREWRYLTRITKTAKPLRPLKLWAHRKELSSIPARRTVRRTVPAFNLSGSRVLNFARNADTQARPANFRRRRDWMEDEDGNVVITD